MVKSSIFGDFLEFKEDPELEKFMDPVENQDKEQDEYMIMS